MHRQKKRNKKSKKRKIQNNHRSIEYKHYQPDNQLTKYFEKLIYKSSN